MAAPTISTIAQTSGLAQESAATSSDATATFPGAPNAVATRLPANTETATGLGSGLCPQITPSDFSIELYPDQPWEGDVRVSDPCHPDAVVQLVWQASEDRVRASWEERQSTVHLDVQAPATAGQREAMVFLVAGHPGSSQDAVAHVRLHVQVYPLPGGMPVVGILLTPSSIELGVGSSHTVTARLTDSGGKTQVGAPVTFAVGRVGGTNLGCQNLSAPG